MYLTTNVSNKMTHHRTHRALPWRRCSGFPRQCRRQSQIR
jgi:hypothetical protein